MLQALRSLSGGLFGPLPLTVKGKPAWDSDAWRSDSEEVLDDGELQDGSSAAVDKKTTDADRLETRSALMASKGEISSDDDDYDNDVLLVSDDAAAASSDGREFERITFDVPEDALERQCQQWVDDVLLRGSIDDDELLLATHKRGGRFVRASRKNAKPRLHLTKGNAKRREHHYKATRRARRNFHVTEQAAAHKENVERQVGSLRPGVRYIRAAYSAPSHHDDYLAEEAREREEAAILEAIIAETRVAAAEVPAEAAPVAGGLTEAQLRDLMTRELTPEDYELLMALDTSVEKKHLCEADLETLRVRVHRSDDVQDSDATDCHVCLCEFEEEDEKMTLPCGHEFHKQCIVQWLTAQSTACPIDRLEVM